MNIIQPHEQLEKQIDADGQNVLKYHPERV